MCGTGTIGAFMLLYSDTTVNNITSKAFRPVVTVSSDMEIGEKVNNVWQIK